MKPENLDLIQDLMRERELRVVHLETAVKLLTYLESKLSGNPVVRVEYMGVCLCLDYSKDEEITSKILLEVITKEENLIKEIEQRLKPL